MTEENVLTRTLGCIIANRIGIYYNGHCEMEFRAIKSNYLANKMREAVKIQEKLIEKLKITNHPIEEMIEEKVVLYTDFINDILELDEVDQKRIANLITKIKNTKKS